MVLALSRFILTVNLVFYIARYGVRPGCIHPSIEYIVLSLGAIILRFVFWITDVVKEATNLGCQTHILRTRTVSALLLFLLSEVIFFFTFFWAYFHSALREGPELITWPPFGVIGIYPFGVPLLNTAILLSSGARVTWAHHSIYRGDIKKTFVPLILSIVLGVYFCIIQVVEFLECGFSISDRVYGSVFFITTGFHGLHVILGTVILRVRTIRLYFYHFTSGRILGLEFSIWYWHLVDFVWLLVYAWIYCWGQHDGSFTLSP